MWRFIQPLKIKGYFITLNWDRHPVDQLPSKIVSRERNTIPAIVLAEIVQITYFSNDSIIIILMAIKVR